MSAGARLAIGTMIVVATTVYMSFVGASASWQYYLTVDECLAQQEQLGTQPLRINGQVLSESLRTLPDRGGIEFQLAGTQDILRVTYAGRVPDNLKDGQQVVVEGSLQGPCLLVANSVLTRCASKYAAE